MKDKGLIKAAGISLNTLTHKDDEENADCLQIPCSIPDHRKMPPFRRHESTTAGQAFYRNFGK